MWHLLIGMIKTAAKALGTGCWVLLGKKGGILSDKCFENGLHV